MADPNPRNRSGEPFCPQRIVSGGQTGVDRGALDAAIDLGLGHGGWCPRGRLAEDGSIPSRYEMQEMDSPEYTARTEQNVIDSDATLILHDGQLRGGTLLTKRIAARLGKPTLAVRLDDPRGVETIRRWLTQTRPTVLNVAGPRGSSNPGIAERTEELLLRVLTGSRE
ncbi:putative molybdenum carrier protein [Candidatus Laterigemmans baculatus]|uniref:putative molybdenum carrier protein n=1 Tax=Candidatus Laterigemmans baculatus TaxID=2770505 RepID=UPI0013DB9523|nr:putative molybdenum carrier protein [Candidatus Laterigemmans baculatus]